MSRFCFAKWGIVQIAMTCILLGCGGSGRDVVYDVCAHCGKGAICRAMYDYCGEENYWHVLSHSCRALPSSCAKAEDVCAVNPWPNKPSHGEVPDCALDAWGGSNAQSNLEVPCEISPDGVVILSSWCD
jgi:hypothetical protein